MQRLTASPARKNRKDSNSGSDESFIVERIYKAVMEQRLAPNTKLNEARLCETFNVGRMRVRRALLLLSSQGIIKLHSNRGAYIACPNKSEASDVFAARMLIEPPLVRQLAQKSGDVDLTILTERCCQTNSNTSQSTTITQIYEAQIWNHSVRAALRFCL